MNPMEKNPAKPIVSVTQWKKEYLPEMTTAERIDSAIAMDNHVGAILAARVLSAHQNNTLSGR